MEGCSSLSCSGPQCEDLPQMNSSALEQGGPQGVHPEQSLTLRMNEGSQLSIGSRHHPAATSHIQIQGVES